MKDSLEDRMKAYYEDRSRIYLPRRTYTVIRIDGKAFHTYTNGCTRPFDEALIKDMDETTLFLCQNVQNTKLAYVQSDEISLILTDFDKLTTASWFDGNVQKMTSIASSLATSKFNQLRTERILTDSWKSYVYGRGQDDEPFFLNWDFTVALNKIKLAQFDARVFTVPSREEVINYLIWRQQDATRNSISMVAQSMYSHKELNKKSTDDMQEMIFQKGQNWNNYPVGQKRGRLIVKQEKMVEIENPILAFKESLITYEDGKAYVKRDKWSVTDPVVFTQGKDFLREQIPSMD